MAPKAFSVQATNSDQLGGQGAVCIQTSPAPGIIGSSPMPPQPPGPASLTPHADKQGRFKFRPITRATAHRIGIYGPGGIGKTSVACRAPERVGVFDLDDSLDRLALSLQGVRVRPISGVDNWADLLAALGDTALWQDIRTIVIDSLTRAEQMAVTHTLKTVPHEKGLRIKRVEDYGYGKGYQHIFETFIVLFSLLDAHVRAGRNVILICHDCTANVPNPAGEDYIRYEPRLQSPTSGKASIRLALREWVDHLFFVGYDVVASRDGKAQGSGTRTIYPVEQPHFMAKSRTLAEPIVYEQGSSLLWQQLFS